MVVASFSMVGIPITGGFVSKFMLARGSIEAGYPFFIVLIVISGLLNAMYYFPILWQMFFVPAGGPVDEREHELHASTHALEQKSSVQLDQIPLSMKIPIAATALGIIVLGITGKFLYEYLYQIVLFYLV